MPLPAPARLPGATLLLACLLRAPARGLEVAAAGASPPGRFIVPLHRQRVPVQSDAETVSYKSVYFGTVSVGAPQPQKFSVVFDTGSGHIIVPSHACLSPTCQIHNRYRREDSLHAVDVDYDGTPVVAGAPRDQITVAFGTGEVTGQFVNDKLCLGSKEEGHLAEGAPSRSAAGDLGATASDGAPAAVDEGVLNCVDVRIVTATEMTHEPFHAFAFDGVLGLGLDSLALAPEFSFFGMMTAQKRLLQPSFGVFLAESDDESSEISFGGHSPELVRSGLEYAPVAYPELGYWQVSITRLRIGNRTLDYCNDGQCRAVVDTGTSLLAVPKEFSDELQGELEGPLKDPELNADDGDMDCRKASGALLHFDVGDITLTLGPGDYARQSILLQESKAGPDAVSSAAPGPAGDGVAAAAAEVRPRPAAASDGGHQANPAPAYPIADDWEGAPRTCKPTLMPIDLPEPLGPKLFIWGEPVLRKYYTVYNWQEKKIGFGLAVHSQQEEVETPVAPTASRPKPLLRPLLL